MQISSLLAVCEKIYDNNLPVNYEWYLLTYSKPNLKLNTAKELLSVEMNTAIKLCRQDGRTLSVAIDNKKDGSTSFSVIDNLEKRKSLIMLSRNNVQELLQGKSPKEAISDNVRVIVNSDNLLIGFFIPRN
jgi:hypothetical protein